MFFPLCGSEWIFYILIAAEVLTPLPEKNAGESLPLPQGGKSFHVEFAIFVLIWCKFSFWLKTKSFFGWNWWAKLGRENILHMLYMNHLFMGGLGNCWVLHCATGKLSGNMLKTGVYYPAELWVEGKAMGLAVEAPCLSPALHFWASLVAQMVKNLLAMQESQVQYLGREDALEKGMATHSSILAWRIPWTEEPSGLHTVHRAAKESDTTEQLTLPLPFI